MGLVIAELKGKFLRDESDVTQQPCSENRFQGMWLRRSQADRPMRRYPFTQAAGCDSSTSQAAVFATVFHLFLTRVWDGRWGPPKLSDEKAHWSAYTI